MQYKKLKIHYTVNSLDKLIGVLYDYDIVNIVIEDEADKPYVEFCLEETEFDNLNGIKEEMMNEISIEEKLMTGEEMEGLYKEYYEVVRITDNIVIVPEWESYEANKGENVVKLKSGMAWGNGQHETTTLCAQALEKYVKNGDKVIDVGTGTGILAIIARKLGAGDIKAVDIDKYSIDVTKENLALNKIENVDVEFGELEVIKDFKADVIVANIVAESIIEISKVIDKYLYKEGIFISSGISSRKLDSVVKSLNKMEILDIKSKNDWNVVVARKII